MASFIEHLTSQGIPSFHDSATITASVLPDQPAVKLHFFKSFYTFVDEILSASLVEYRNFTYDFIAISAVFYVKPACYELKLRLENTKSAAVSNFVTVHIICDYDSSEFVSNYEQGLIFDEQGYEIILY